MDGRKGRSKTGKLKINWIVSWSMKLFNSFDELLSSMEIANSKFNH